MSANWFSVSKATLIDILTKLTSVFDTKADVSHSHTKNDITDFPTLGTAAAKDVPSSGNATSSQVVMGNDTRLSDSRTPKSHTHTKNQITDFPTNVSAFNNDAGYLTSYTDDKVQQIASNDIDSTYEMIFAGSNLTTTQTATVRKSDRLKFNPSTGELSIGSSSASGSLTLYESLSGAKGRIIFFGDTDQSFLLPNAGGFIALADDIKNGKLTIQKNGTNVAMFYANQSTNTVANITVPTKTTELTNDAGFTTNVGTITGIKMNGSTVGSSGVVDLGTVITAHQDISGKADKTATVSTVAWDSTNKKLTKTINGTTTDVVTGATILGGLTKTQVTTALGYTPPTSDTNTTYTLAAGTGDDANKLIFTPSSGSATKVTVPYATSAGSAPASDVYAWAKASTKPSYTLDEVTDGSTRKLANYLPLSGGTLTGNLTAPKFVGSLDEANLTWGGKNFSSNYGCIDAALMDELGANRFQFIKADAITVEYTRDGGTTWTDYGATDSQKQCIFAQGGGLIIGKADSTHKATEHPGLYQLRITIDTGVANVYSVLNKFIIYLSSNGSANCACKIQRALQSTPTTFVDHTNWITVGGWSGYNVLNVGAFATYGNSPSSQYGRVRFIFKDGEGGNTNYIGLSILQIKAFGGVGWYTPSNMAKTGHLYSYNEAQDAIFPRKVTATKFIGALQGNADSASSVAWSGVTGIPSSFTPSSHTHGNIQNGGTLQTNDVAIANGDKLVVTDSSDSSKIARASISFDGSTATKCLTQKGTWESFLSSHQSVTNKDATLAWSTKSTIATIGSTNITVSLPANPNTDTKVTQTETTNDSDYEVLFSGTGDNTTRTEGVRKSSGLTYNPHFKLLELPGGSIDTQMFASEADGYEQGYMTSVRSGNNIHCTLKLGGDNSAVGILRIGNSSGKDAFIKYDSSATSNCDITLPSKDGTIITTSGGATMTGSLSCSTPGADIHWGDITIYGGGSNGNTNAMLIGDDVIIGDCNIGGYLGMKAKSGSTVGFKFMNSSGGNIGELKSNNGALQFVQSGTPYHIWHDGNWSATRAQGFRIIYEYGSGSPRVIGVRYTSAGYMEVSCDTTAYGVNWWQSDTKLKENIKPTEKTALDKVDQIEFIQFDWKNKEEHEDNIHVDLGVSANQIEEFMPDAVWDIEQPEACEFDTLKNIDTGKMSTYALKAIQELHKIVKSQAQEIANLKSQLT